MSRIDHNYPPTSPETVKALLTAYEQMHQGDTCKDPTSPAIASLLTALPQGSLTKARFDGETSLIAFTIKDRNERFIEPEAFLTLRAFSLFETGALFIDKNSTDKAERKDYPEVFGNLGITVPRLMADAQKSEMVKLEGDHHDLSAPNLRTVPGARKIQRGRREALAAALAAYDKNAEEWGLTGMLSRWDYQTMIEGSFKHYDIRHGHHHVRPVLERKAG